MRFFLVVVALGALLTVPFQASATEVLQHGPQLGVMHAHHGAGQAGAVQGSGQLTWHGGPVMRVNTTYTVYWFPAGSTYDPNYKSTINGYLQNVAAANGATDNVYASDTQYTDSTGPVAYNSSYGGSYTDTTPFPASGCNTGNGRPCLTDTQLYTELQSAVSAAGWTVGPNKLFFIMTPKNVDSCFDSTNSSCSFTYYCAYHSWIVNGSYVLLYANMPYADTVSFACNSQQHPNGNDADDTLNVLSHEHNEAITDPQGTAWWDAAGYENGDKCAWTFGTPLGSTASGSYNQVIGTGKYYLQEEYSNASSSCVLSYGPPAAPTLTSFNPGQGGTGTSVTLTGTNFTGATSVQFHGTSASFTVNSGTQITTSVPGGATSGTISVTTPGGTATSLSSFTILTPPTISSFSPTQGAVGTAVTINGTNFSGATAVKFHGTSSSFTINPAGTQISTTVPTGATTGQIQVTTPNGTATSANSFKVLPKITSISPTSAKTGATVNIYGTSLTGATSVKFSGPAAGATFTVVTDGQISATVPKKAQSGPITVTTPGGTATSPAFTKL